MKKTYLLLTFLCCLGIVTAHAQYKDILDFNGAKGFDPRGSLILSGSTLYGMTEYGGGSVAGCIFSIDSTGSGYVDLHDFTAATGDHPQGNLILSGTTLYGMCHDDGANSDGCVFSIQTNGTGYTDLYDFTGTTTSGKNPCGSLVLSGTTLYGMTNAGGAHNGGVIFSISTTGTGFTDMYDFPIGASPNGSLVLSGTTLYGMTFAAGGSFDGIIFSIQTNGTGYTDLYDFTGTTGQYPDGSLILSGSTLYGMTQGGGANSDGVVFSISTSGTGYTDIFDFNGTNGNAPYGDLVLSGSTLYGMTYYGGANNKGCVFSVSTTGTNYVKMLDFNGTNGNGPDGSLIFGAGSELFGMTSGGGANTNGIIFGISKNAVASVNNITTANESMTTYPNPSNGVFTIKSSINSHQSIVEVYNLLGEKTYKGTLRQAQGDNKIDLSGQPNGLYFIRTLDENGIQLSTGKIIIQK